MTKVIAIFLIIFSSACSQADLSSDFKSKNGIHTCVVSAERGSQNSCDHILEFSNDLTFTWAQFPNTFSNSVFSGGIFLIGDKIKCDTKEEFFPISLVELRSETKTEKVVIGIPASVKNNPKELTTFFDFQMKYPKEMKSISDWIKDEFSDEWILVSWENEKEARSYLERSIKNF